ncbi:MAG: NAD(P)-dependent oxidoreductase [Myxococcales bacterium]|nr:NAD(P)-dependent oxidoreductase [Myxococcales bacterium]
MTKIAFLGTGLIGAGLAEAAARRGLHVTVWNRTRAKAEAIPGAHVADSPEAAVAGAVRIHIALTDDAVVQAVLDQVLAHAPEALASAVVVDHTTTGPEPTAARAKALAERGIRYLHAPVFMSPQMCKDAAGVMLAAGPKSTYQAVAGALAEMTGKVQYLGEEPGRAAAFKLFGNAMIFFVVQGLSDVFAMAKNLGISAEDARSLFDTFSPVGVLQYRGANMARGDYAAAFELTMARKDARLMLEAAGAEATPGLEAIAARMDDLIQRGFGANDLGVLAVDAVPKR